MAEEEFFARPGGHSYLLWSGNQSRTGGPIRRRSPACRSGSADSLLPCFLGAKPARVREIMDIDPVVKKRRKLHAALDLSVADTSISVEQISTGFIFRRFLVNRVNLLSDSAS